jgi:predicted N-formylglutamate amidohydrolase
VDDGERAAMTEAFTILSGGDAPILIVGDHASNHVPEDIDLGIAPALLNDHVALDIGVSEVAALLGRRLRCGAILGGVSRLVIDLNREEDRDGLVPVASDGHAISGNIGVNKAARLERFYHPYHAEVAARLAAMHRPFILSLHSFTPCLASDPAQQRPWEIGVLYNGDDRAARIAIPMLEAAGWAVGDQLPYSGKLLNATMNRHAEGNGIPYLGIEMRQDISATMQGQARYADILADVVGRCRVALA